MATSEDRLDAYYNERRASVIHEFPLADGEVLPIGTLAVKNGSGEFEALTHSAGDDDSGVVPLAVLDFYDEDLPYQELSHYDRGGTDGQARGYSGVILELENDDSDLTGYTPLETTAYAVDNETVSATEADGSSGSRAPVGTVYDVHESDGTVLVHVEGIL